MEPEPEEPEVVERQPRITDNDDFMGALVHFKDIDIKMVFNITFHVKL